MGCADSHGQADEVAGERAAQQCSAHVVSTGYAGVRASVFALREGFPEVGGIEADEGRTMSAVSELDLNGDGFRDLIMRDSYGGAALISEPVTLTIVWGSDAPFEEREQEHVVIPIEVSPAPLTLTGDLDGDGIADLRVDYIGGLISSMTLDVLSAEERTCGAIGDVDGDGAPDSGCISRNGEGPRTVWIRFGGSVPPREVVMEGISDWTFGVSRAGDIDGDGMDEVIVRGEEGVGIWHHDDPASFDVAEIAESGTVWARAAGDIDGDGMDDLVVRDGRAYELFFGGESSLRAESIEAPDNVSITVLGDADCDGFADLLFDHSVDDARSEVSLRRGGEDGLSSTPAWESLVYYLSELAVVYE